jgi:nucleoside 2-deoxyribosyltransferase
VSCQLEISEFEEKIKKLEEFKVALASWSSDRYDAQRRTQMRTYINQNKTWVRQEIIEAGCFVTVTIGPPPAIGGLLMRNLDPFSMIFDAPYGRNLIPLITDMIDQTVGVLLARPKGNDEPDVAVDIDVQVLHNYAFVAMAMHAQNPELDDVLDAIKESASRCGIQAERIDEPQSNERITDRVLESIRRAEYVVVDLTYSKPNVYYEAGYAQALGKTPIYVAKEGTLVEFDLKDYPIIFFTSLKQLKDSLEKRLRGLGERKT